jgi:hypothetical protein
MLFADVVVRDQEVLGSETQQTLFILFDGGEGVASDIIYRLYNFIQQSHENEVEYRLSAIESKIDELMNFILRITMIIPREY